MIDNYVVFSALLVYMLYEYITLAASALHCTLHVSTEMVGVL